MFAISTSVTETLTALQASGLERLSSWDLEAPARKVAERNCWTWGYAQAVSQEYRNFVALLVINPNATYGMAGPVDEFWHEHILHTRDYQSMCSATVGEFVHHEAAAVLASDGVDFYADETIPALHRTFGEISPIWPSIECSNSTAKCCNGHIHDGL